MPAQDAFILHLNDNIALADQHKQTALSLVEQAESVRNAPALIAAKAAADRADKARALFEQALEFPRQTKKAIDYRQIGLEHLDGCERQLNKAADLLEQK